MAKKDLSKVVGLAIFSDRNKTRMVLRRQDKTYEEITIYLKIKHLEYRQIEDEEEYLLALESMPENTTYIGEDKPKPL